MSQKSDPRPPTYALVVRSEVNSFLAVMGTKRQLRTPHGALTRAFHALLLSLFQLVAGADHIDVVEWERGVNAKTAVPLLVTRRVGESHIVCNEPEKREVQA